MVSQVQCWTTPPEQQGCSLYVPPKMPSLVICHEFHAPISVTKLPAILGETASAEDGTSHHDASRKAEPQILSHLLRVT